MPADELTMKGILPFWGRATLMESTVDETQTEGGLIVPIAFDGDDGLKRGVVLAVDNPWDEGTTYHRAVAEIEVGTVVYYRGGTRIRGVIVVDMNEIVAFEAGDG